LNLRRQALARQTSNVPAKGTLQLLTHLVSRRPTAAEVSGGIPLKLKASVIPMLAAAPEYAGLTDDVLVEMARQKTYRRLHIADRWVAIALLLGTEDILPVYAR
jgi:hypothetical protein